MLDAYLSIVTNPLFAAALLMGAVFLVLQNFPKPENKLKPPAPLSENRLLNAIGWFGFCLLPFGIALLAAAVWELVLLFLAFPEKTDSPADIRWHASIVLAMFAAIGALFTLLFAFIRLFTTERQTRAAEKQRAHEDLVLVNQRIQSALQLLSARRPAHRIGRTLFFDAENGKDAFLEWHDDASADRASLTGIEAAEWKSFEWEEPDQETRLSAIGQFDAIAREHPDRRRAINEHLANFARANAPSSTARNYPDDKEQK